MPVEMAISPDVLVNQLWLVAGNSHASRLCDEFWLANMWDELTDRRKSRYESWHSRL